MLKRRREEEARRDAQDVVVRLERHQDDPEQREQEEQPDEGQRDGAEHAGEEGGAVHDVSPQARPFARSRRRIHCLMKIVERTLVMSQSTIIIAAERPMEVKVNASR